MERVHIKRNDQVVVTAGKDRGARGKVLRVLPTEKKAIVERINMIKRHTRPNPQKGIQGGILEREAPIHLSNLMVVCPSCGKPTRVSHERRDQGGAVRLCKHCGGTLS
jgi:large subunit ribosomal protein L24